MQNQSLFCNTPVPLLSILSMKYCAKVAGYFRRAGGVNPLVTLPSQIGNQLARKSYQGHH